MFHIRESPKLSTVCGIKILHESVLNFYVYLSVDASDTNFYIQEKWITCRTCREKSNKHLKL